MGNVWGIPFAQNCFHILFYIYSTSSFPSSGDVLKDVMSGDCVNSFEKGRHLNRDLGVQFPPIPHLAVITGDRAAFFPHETQASECKKECRSSCKVFYPSVVTNKMQKKVTNNLSDVLFYFLLYLWVLSVVLVKDYCLL